MQQVPSMVGGSLAEPWGLGRYEILRGNTQFPGSSLDTGKEILTLHLHSPVDPA